MGDRQAGKAYGEQGRAGDGAQSEPPNRRDRRGEWLRVGDPPVELVPLRPPGAEGDAGAVGHVQHSASRWQPVRSTWPRIAPRTRLAAHARSAPRWEG